MNASDVPFRGVTVCQVSDDGVTLQGCTTLPQVNAGDAPFRGAQHRDKCR